jgi:hypothetical protein
MMSGDQWRSLMSDRWLTIDFGEMHPGLVDLPCISRGTGAQPLCYRESAAFPSAAGFNPYSALTFASGVMVFRVQNRAQEGHPTSNPAGLRTWKWSPAIELADAFMPWTDFKREWEKYPGDEGHQMVSKLRSAAARQEPEPDATDDLAVLDLTTDVLADLGLLGSALILLASRNCTPRCAVSTRSHRLRHREFGPID